MKNKARPCKKKSLDKQKNFGDCFHQNLPENSSRLELEALYYHAVRIVDRFVPRDKFTDGSKGFTFLRFVNMVETKKAIDLWMVDLGELVESGRLLAY